MRVLAIANHVGSRGGLERTQLTNCRALADRGHEVDLVYVTPGDFTGDWQSFAHSMTRIDGSLPRSRAPVSSTLAMVRAVRAARALAPDVVYVYRYLDVPLAAAIRRATGAPVVLHLCLPQPGDLPLLVRRSLSAVGTTISVSRDTAEDWRGTRLSSTGVVVVQTGIDMDHYVPAGEAARMATRHALGLEADDFVVLYAGRIGPLKGVHVLVEAFRDLAEKLESARMVIVGGPSLSAAPDQAARYVAELRARSDAERVVWLEPRRDVLAPDPDGRRGRRAQCVARAVLAFGHRAPGLWSPSGRHPGRRQPGDPDRVAGRLPGPSGRSRVPGRADHRPRGLAAFGPRARRPVPPSGRRTPLTGT